MTRRLKQPNWNRTEGNSSGWALALLVLAAIAGWPAGAAAEATPELDADVLESRIAALESSYGAGADADQQNALQRALASIEERDGFTARARELHLAGEQATEQAAQIREEISQLSVDAPDLTLSDDAGVEQIEQQLSIARADLLAAEQAVDRLRGAVDELRAQPAAIETALAEASETRRGLEQRIGQLADDDEPTDDASLVAAQAELEAAIARAEMLRTELLTQPARLVLLEAQRDRAALQLEQRRARVDALGQLVTRSREMEAERTLSDSGAQDLLANTDSGAIAAALEFNRALAEELASLGERTRQAVESNRAAEQGLADLRSRFESARQRLEVAGFSPAIGRLLEAEEQDLPEATAFRKQSRLREQQISEASLRSLQLDDLLAESRLVPEKIETLLATVAAEKTETVRPELEMLFTARESLLRQLAAANNDYLRAISNLEATESQTLLVVAAFREFLSRNLLWLRNETPLGLFKLLKLPGEFAALAQAPGWAEGLRVGALNFARSPLQIALLLLALAYHWKRRSLHERLRATAAKVDKPSADSMKPTLVAIGYTLAFSLPWPIFALVVGHSMSTGAGASEASAVYGAALTGIAPLFFFLLAVRNLCLEGGLAEAHFHWRRAGLDAFRREVSLLGLTLLLPGFFLMIAVKFAAADQTVGFVQLFYLLLVYGLFRFLNRLLRPRRAILSELRKAGESSGQPPANRLIYLFALSMPLFLGAVAVAGFMYSASILLDRTLQTLLFGLALMLISELIARWLLIIKRRARFNELMQRRARKREGIKDEEKRETEGRANVDDEAHLASLDSDSHKFVHSLLVILGLFGVYSIWSPVFPALASLNEVTLWQFTQEVSGEQILQRVSLVDLIVALVIASLTVVAVRYLPALVEIILRQRGSVPSGSRLAFATLARYAIILLGLSFVFSTIGVDWSKLQWLVAALGVGVGFGLQEIVANFISGLIILIERPVRVGDIVSVGDDSGTIVRIRIRATTIRTWEQKEMLVPNKEFITGRVTNWSLSDDMIRIFFYVGIAYGSDVEKALRLIEEAALENETVLADPEPFVTFESFGDNSLNLGLRCYVSDIADRLPTTTALHLAINRKLNEAGIVIAFPQRDVHLDTSSPLEIKLLGARDSEDRK
jgi:potassium efflux system protein